MITQKERGRIEEKISQLASDKYLQEHKDMKEPLK